MHSKLLLLLAAVPSLLASPSPVKRSGFSSGQPIDDNGRGAPILGNNIIPIWYHKRANRLGGTDHHRDVQNPDNLGAQSTDNGFVPNLKWSFSDSKTRLFPGGWVREQVIQDLPQSRDISGAQQHLKKGAIRELHWHRVVRDRTSTYTPCRLGSLLMNIG
jgi:hypothetical protein